MDYNFQPSEDLLRIHYGSPSTKFVLSLDLKHILSSEQTRCYYSKCESFLLSV